MGATFHCSPQVKRARFRPCKYNMLTGQARAGAIATPFGVMPMAPDRADGAPLTANALRYAMPLAPLVCVAAGVVAGRKSWLESWRTSSSVRPVCLT